MANPCDSCGKKLGFLTIKCELKDGTVCNGCIEALGFLTSQLVDPSVVAAMQSISVADLKKAIDGDAVIGEELRTVIFNSLPDKKKAKMDKVTANKEKFAAKIDQEIANFSERYNLTGLNRDDLAVIYGIATDLKGNGLIKAGMAFSFAKAEEQAKVSYLSALVGQNWMIINQLGRLNGNIEKLLEKENEQ